MPSREKTCACLPERTYAAGAEQDMSNAKPVRQDPRVESHKVEDPDGRLLITQRAAHMRTFPRCWVFPGGGVDEGELLFLGSV